MTDCRYCHRDIEWTDDGWVDPAATGDDSTWRETCDAHDTFQAEHEPGVKFDVSFIMQAETEGFANQEDYISGMADGIRSGTVFQLQGSWGRAAASLIEQGIISEDGEVDWDRFEEVVDWDRFEEVTT